MIDHQNLVVFKDFDTGKWHIGEVIATHYELDSTDTDVSVVSLTADVLDYSVGGNPEMFTKIEDVFSRHEVRHIESILL